MVCVNAIVAVCGRDAAASRINNLTNRPISVPQLTFKSICGPQLRTLPGEWGSNYYSENHLTHTHTQVS